MVGAVECACMCVCVHACECMCVGGEEGAGCRCVYYHSGHFVGDGKLILTNGTAQS